MKTSFRTILLVLGLASFLTGCGRAVPAPTNTSVRNNPANINTATVNTGQDNTNQSSVAIALTGKVFVKGYKTPSESYGILTGDGQEIGLGAYDSMKEELRPYVGEQIRVVFTSICHAGSATCCRTTLAECGTVKSWSPLATNSAP